MREPGIGYIISRSISGKYEKREEKAYVVLACTDSTVVLEWLGSVFKDRLPRNDKYAHLKMVIAVGIVMGVHALYTIFVGGTVVTWHIAMVYLPVSLLYISSMTLGYIGLRYIELSISSPICNSSGALVAVLCFLTGTLDDAIEGNMRLVVIGAVALVCIGVIGLGIVEVEGR